MASVGRRTAAPPSHGATGREAGCSDKMTPRVQRAHSDASAPPPPSDSLSSPPPAYPSAWLPLPFSGFPPVPLQERTVSCPQYGTRWSLETGEVVGKWIPSPPIVSSILRRVFPTPTAIPTYPVRVTSVRQARPCLVCSRACSLLFWGGGWGSPFLRGFACSLAELQRW